MEDPSPGQVTQLLDELREGRKGAEHELIPLVYDSLRRLAAYHLSREGGGHTLQPTALVHEAFLRLTERDDLGFRNRTHFFAVSAKIMRRVLVDHARRGHADKRGGRLLKLNLDEALDYGVERSSLLIALDDALAELAEMDPRQCQIVEMRFFGGLTEEEIGQLLGISTRTVRREWEEARIWLYGALHSDDVEPDS